VASAQLLKVALDELADEAELLFVRVAADDALLREALLRNALLRDNMVAYAPDAWTVDDLRDWFAEHDGAAVAFGPYPPFWTTDDAVAVTGYLPRPDGTVYIEAY
jgi:hypothetical protein